MSETYLNAQGLSKRFGSTTALDDVSFELAEGERLALLGPSGCGKTTLLRVLSGLETPDDGTLTIAGESLVGPGVHVPPERRRVGMVFQDWALFPHLDVRHNVAYGLSREPSSSLRVEETLDMVGLLDHADRYPHELSGGQAQRVALARALAPRPRVLLFDEPFSNLDAELRVKVRADVAALMTEVGMTSVFVTHDQEEAFVLGNRVAVMREGRVHQIGAPAEIYDAPASPWIAGFVGEANFIDGIGSGPLAATFLGDVALAEPLWGRCRVLIRPEHLELGDGGAGVVSSVEFYGHDTSYTVTFDERRILVRDLSAPRFLIGDRVSVTYAGPRVAAFDGEEIEVLVPVDSPVG